MSKKYVWKKVVHHSKEVLQILADQRSAKLEALKFGLTRIWTQIDQRPMFHLGISENGSLSSSAKCKLHFYAKFDRLQFPKRLV